MPGAPARVYIKDGPELKGMGRETIPPGAIMVLETAGGGGLGDPAQRDAPALEADRLNGMVDQSQRDGNGI